jgi:hypothetical protein
LPRWWCADRGGPVRVADVEVAGSGAGELVGLQRPVGAEPAKQLSGPGRCCPSRGRPGWRGCFHQAHQQRPPPGFCQQPGGHGRERRGRACCSRARLCAPVISSEPQQSVRSWSVTKVQQARPAISWALLAFIILAAFVVLILVAVWLEPPLSKGDLSAVPAGESRVTLQHRRASCRTASAPRCYRAWPGSWSLAARWQYGVRCGSAGRGRSPTGSLARSISLATTRSTSASAAYTHWCAWERTPRLTDSLS